MSPGGVAMTTVAREFAEWVEHVHELLERPTGATFPRLELADHLAHSIDGGVSWHWANPDGTAGFELRIPIPGWPTPDDDELCGIEGRAHPLFLWYRTTWDPQPTTVGRVPDGIAPSGSRERLFERLGPVGLDQQLCIPYRLSPSGLRFFLVARGCSDFSDDDVDLARRIQPLIGLLARHCTDAAEDQTKLPPHVCDGWADIGLSTRESAVLRLLAEGHTAYAIGRRLCLSPRTVHVHLSHIYRKLGVHDRLQAVLVAARLGLLNDRHDGPRPPERAHPWSARPTADHTTARHTYVLPWS